MLLLHDPRCADYGRPGHPERPARVVDTARHLRTTFPAWTWRVPAAATDEDVLRAHTAAHLQRLDLAEDFDGDTAYFPGIADHARRAAGAALESAESALAGQPAFAFMRPPGHHATADQAMGFCYLNSIAIAALAAREKVERVAVWDFDAHHGNGTEAILSGRPGVLFVSVHQHPGYPGTGTRSFENCRNFPVAPRTPRERHMEALAESWQEIEAFHPHLVLVSAGFDAYADDPITEMTLVRDDFATLGRWLRASRLPAAAVLEGGYSPDLPRLVAAFLGAWSGEERGR
jgi:acetoin utilization deacetylase AcuC-like enzyme